LASMTQVYPARGRHGVGKPGVWREARFGGLRYAKLRLRLKHWRMDMCTNDGDLLDLPGSPDKQLICRLRVSTVWKWTKYSGVTDTDPLGFSHIHECPHPSQIVPKHLVCPSPAHLLPTGLETPSGCPIVRVPVIRLGILYLGRAWCLHLNKWVTH